MLKNLLSLIGDSDKTVMLVIDDKHLGFWSRDMNSIGILRSDSKCLIRYDSDGLMPMTVANRFRIADDSDFDRFKVSSKGFKNPDLYISNLK